MVKVIKIVALVQARLGSSRYPNKVLKTISGRTVIEILLERLTQSKKLDEIAVVTSTEIQDDKLYSFIKALGYRCIRGSEKDVLNRFYESAKILKANVIVRITGDCPLIDPKLVDKCIKGYQNNKVDYFSNIDPSTYPDGLDVEVMSFKAIEKANNETFSKFDREHVTPYIRNSKSFTKSSIQHAEDLSWQRWSIDEPEDLIVVKNIFEYFSPDIFFHWKKVVKLRNSMPKLFEANKNISNNEGSQIGTGQKLYKRAKRIIPGGNMLLSKRPEMFLPEKWPAYFKNSYGCKICDLDGNEYFDMSLMGVGTNILGYGNEEVNEAVSKIVIDGNMSTLNCPEEVYLAEKLIDMHPWADMVKFARSGGEINTIAVRIARAATRKEKIAICGYHGWHDWYLSTNLNDDKNLDGHLLSGLEPNGVPRGLINTTLTFNYNNIEELKKIISENKDEIAAIKMEVSRNEGPSDGYLKKVRKLANDNNIILIFDECTSGFRETFGGLHKKYGVDPDIAIFGKALGNGYAISACIGKKEFMESAQKTFISSTFWTERIGPTAALKTLEIMEREKSWETISELGTYVREKWSKLAKKHGLNITISGIPALSSFMFKSQKNLHYKTFITQEMLKKGFLATNSIYVCTQHTKELIDRYIKSLDPIFATIRKCEDNLDIYTLLEGPVCHNGFKRLN